MAQDALAFADLDLFDAVEGVMLQNHLPVNVESWDEYDWREDIFTPFCEEGLLWGPPILCETGDYGMIWIASLPHNGEPPHLSPILTVAALRRRVIDYTRLPPPMLQGYSFEFQMQIPPAIVYTAINTTNFVALKTSFDRVVLMGPKCKAEKSILLPPVNVEVMVNGVLMSSFTFPLKPLRARGMRYFEKMLKVDFSKATGFDAEKGNVTLTFYHKKKSSATKFVTMPVNFKQFIYVLDKVEIHYSPGVLGALNPPYLHFF